MTYSSLLIALALVGGCVEASDVEIEVAAKKLNDCPDWGCGTNSPVIDGLGFHDLNLQGQPNLSGFHILRMEKLIGGVTRTITPRVVDGELTATYAGNPVAVTGARFVLHNNQTNKLYSLLVAQAIETSLWVPVARGKSAWVPAYEFKWAEYGETDGRHRFLCGKNPDTTASGFPFVGDFKAVVFENDWIVADTITVQGERANWFNIGCAGTAVAKQHLTGYTKAAQTRTGQLTTPAERTANLKMFSADYCGVGIAFTVAGQPLRWRDAKGMYNSITAVNPLETRWTATGATCLNTARVDFTQTPDNLAVFPAGVADLITSTCNLAGKTLLPCTGTTSDLLGASMVSANVP